VVNGYKGPLRGGDEGNAAAHVGQKLRHPLEKTVEVVSQLATNLIQQPLQRRVGLWLGSVVGDPLHADGGQQIVDINPIAKVGWNPTRRGVGLKQ
jgi:hypothetical protein